MMHPGWAWTGGPLDLNHLGPWPYGWGVLGLVSLLVHLLFWVALICVAVMLLRRTRDRPRRSDGLDILEQRYARGEIDRQEFLERRSVLLGEHPGGPPPRSH